MSQNRRGLNKFMYGKIAELLNLMSKYVEFEKVLNELIQTEKEAEFSFTNEWLKSIFFSKNDQEFLYKSARVLLSNENTQLIETIVKNHENGFKGDVYAGCSVCGERLGAKYSQSPWIFWMCGHNYHSKCFQEEIKNIKMMETRNKIDQKPEWPICRKTNVYLEEKQKRKFNNSRRRKDRKHNDSQNESSEDSMNLSTSSQNESKFRFSWPSYVKI